MGDEFATRLTDSIKSYIVIQRELVIAVVVDQASRIGCLHVHSLGVSRSTEYGVLFLKGVVVVELLEPLLLHHHPRHQSWQLTSIYQPLLLTLLSCLPSSLTSVPEWLIQKHFTGLVDSPSIHTLYRP